MATSKDADIVPRPQISILNIKISVFGENIESLKIRRLVIHMTKPVQSRQTWSEHCDNVVYMGLLSS